MIFSTADIRYVQPNTTAEMITAAHGVYVYLQTLITEMSSDDGIVEDFASFVFGYIGKKFGLDSIVKQVRRHNSVSFFLIPQSIFNIFWS